jgi:hypothetical protein
MDLVPRRLIALRGVAHEQRSGLLDSSPSTLHANGPERFRSAIFTISSLVAILPVVWHSLWTSVHAVEQILKCAVVYLQCQIDRNTSEFIYRSMKFKSVPHSTKYRRIASRQHSDTIVSSGKAAKAAFLLADFPMRAFIRHRRAALLILSSRRSGGSQDPVTRELSGFQ